MLLINLCVCARRTVLCEYVLVPSQSFNMPAEYMHLIFVMEDIRNYLSVFQARLYNN